MVNKKNSLEPALCWVGSLKNDSEVQWGPLVSGSGTKPNTNLIAFSALPIHLNWCLVLEETKLNIVVIKLNVNDWLFLSKGRDYVTGLKEP